MKAGRVPLAVALDEGLRTRLAAVATRLSARAHEVLVETGDALSDVFVLAEGGLCIYALTPDGREATLYRLRPGEMCLLSLTAAFTDGRYPANVRVESASAEILRIPGEVVRRLFAEDAALQTLVLGSLTATIRDLLAHLDQALLWPLKDRLLNHLAHSADSEGRVHATHQAIADSLGVTREAISRELLRLGRAGRLTTGRGCIALARDSRTR